MTLPMTGQASSATHVLVADGGKAILYRAIGSKQSRVLQELETFERPSAHLRASELTSDRAGRVFESSGRGGTNPTHTRHGAAGDFDPHEVEIDRYVTRILQRLETLHRAGELGRLALIAEPRLLGVLRRKLPSDLRQLTVREVSGDYVHAESGRILGLIDAFEES